MCDSLENLRRMHARCESIRQRSMLMVISEERSCFYFHREGERLITLPVGYGFISARYFKHLPPTPDEIEAAINTLEDEIERVVPVIPSTGYSLYSDDAFVREFAALAGVPESPVIELSRDELEHLFGQYAEISMGRPARREEAEASVIFYAQLLIVREFLHHLKFDAVHVIDTSDDGN